MKPTLGIWEWCIGTLVTQILNGTKKQLKKVPVGGSANWGTSASFGTKIKPWTDDFFSNFVGGKNLTLFKPLMILNKIHENITKTLFCENI